MQREIVRHRAVPLLAAFVGLLCLVYRFNTLGEGGLAGFTNDQFGYLARARQMLAGELPVRDFNDPGWFLTDVASAAAQYLGGYNLLSEAILTTGMLAVGAATTFALGYRVSRSMTAALVAALFHIAIAPRHYNYPKITFYALSILLAWRYIDRPTVVRLILLAVCIGIAALFRHDHAIYLGGFAALTTTLVHRREPGVLWRRGALLVIVSFAIVVPFLAFLHVNGGIREYYRTTMVYANRDFARADFSFPQFDLDGGVTGANATAWLYYLFLALPVLSGAALAVVDRRVVHGRAGAPRVLIDRTYLVPLMALAVAINYSFMSRGSTSARVPDVAVTSAILTAWLLAAILGRTAHWLFASQWLRASIRIATVLVVTVSVIAVDALANTLKNVDISRLSEGPSAAADRMATVWDTLSASPPLAAFSPQMPGLVRMARYINACTRPDDRLFLLGELPELYYLSGRLIAGGHSWLLPGYYSDDLDERLILERLRHSRVPIVVTPVRDLYDAEYRPNFDLIHEYLTQNYADAGDVDLDDQPKLRVLFRRDLVSSGTYAPLGLPCFHNGPENAAFHEAAR